MTSGPAAVLFDMDGTLVDTEHLWMRSEIAVMRRLGSPWGEEDQKACLGTPLEAVVAYMSQRARLHQPVDVIESWLLETMESLIRETELEWRPGARSLLLECRTLGIPTALVSASWERLITAVHDHIGQDLASVPFDIIVAGDHVTNSKPHPEPYLRAARLLGVPIAECLALEDSPPGIASAVASGARVVAIPQIVDTVPNTGGVHVVSSLLDLSIGDLWRATA